MPDRLPALEYDEHEIVRTVPATKAYISFKGASGRFRRPFAASGSPSARSTTDGQYGVFFAAHQIATIDLTEPKVSVMSPNRCRSCPRTKHLTRPSTSLYRYEKKDVDARLKATGVRHGLCVMRLL